MRLMGGTRSKMEGAHNDKKTKITTITARVYITSLNLNSSEREILLRADLMKTHPHTEHTSSQWRRTDRSAGSSP